MIMYKISYILNRLAGVYKIIHVQVYEISYTLNRMKNHTSSSVYIFIHAQVPPSPSTTSRQLDPFPLLQEFRHRSLQRSLARSLHQIQHRKPSALCASWLYPSGNRRSYSHLSGVPAPYAFRP